MKQVMADYGKRVQEKDAELARQREQIAQQKESLSQQQETISKLRDELAKSRASQNKEFEDKATFNQPVQVQEEEKHSKFKP